MTKRRQRLDAAEVRALARGRWLEIHQALAGDVLGDVLQVKLGTHVQCPFHGGDKDFRFDPPRGRYGSSADHGGAICTCGQWRDGFELLKEARGWTFPQALEAVARYLGLDVQDPRERRQAVRRAEYRARQARAKRERQARRQAQNAMRAIARVWDTSLRMSDPRAQSARWYLARRGLSPAPVLDCPDLRFHPQLPCYQRTEQGLVHLGDHPALIALVRDPNGRPVTIHRTYLTREGDKLPVVKPKKLMSVPRRQQTLGAAIRLFPADRVLGIAEGIETALAVQFATGMPVWSTVSAPLLEQFQPPPGVRQVVIWTDRDRSGAGQAAARALCKRLWAQDIHVRIELPDMPIPDDAKSVDWNDVWQVQGRVGFPMPKALRRAS